MKALFTLLLLLICIKVYGPENLRLFILKHEVINPYEKLYKAICMEESSIRSNIINQEEQAYGIVQIRQIRLDDYQRLTGKHYELKDCLKTSVSKEIFMFYAMRYNNDLSLIARKWNGSGRETYKYWNRINKKCKKIILLSEY